MGGGAPSYPQQDIGAELGQILKLLPQFVQKQVGLARRFGPVMARQDIKSAQEFGPQYLDLNIGQLQRNIAGQPLLSTLNKQALSQLQLGGQLSPAESRDVTQQTRAGFAARGNVMGNQALGSELLNRDIYSQQKLKGAQQFASGVQNLNLSQLQGLGGVQRPGGSFAPLAAGIGATQGSTQSLLGFGSNIFDANQSAAAAESAAGANKSSGTMGAITSVVGAAAAAY